MGEDKAELKIAGESFYQRALKLLKSVHSELILVSGHESQADAIPVPDIIPHAGPPGGLYSCLEYLRGMGKLDDSPLLIIPLDMPLLHKEALMVLLEGVQELEACHYEGEVLPCVVRASENLRQYVEDLFTESHKPGGKRSMRAILNFCNSKVLQKKFFSEKIFKNINTFQDYISMNPD